MRRAETGGYALRGSRSATGSSSNNHNAAVRGGTTASSAAASAAITRHRRVKQELQDDQKKELKEAFELFDAEKNGSIDYHELKASVFVVVANVGM